MRYDITLSISYVYQSPAAGARQILHLMPRDRIFFGAGRLASGPQTGGEMPPVRQRMVAGRLSIDPEPAFRQDRADFFTNAISEVSFSGSHREARIGLQARMEVFEAAGHIDEGLLLSALPAALSACRALEPDSPLHFQAASPRVPFDPAIADYARRFRSDGPVSGIVESIGRALHEDLRFDPEATTAITPVGEAFRARHGVCQDFSQIMISALRSIGVPAGYVSGFLRTIPPPGQPRLEGADAMHAWIRAWCGPQAGWIEYDPTNAMFAGTDHVVVAYGRDYSDVAPVRGAMRTAGAQTSKQTVDMVPLPD